MATPMIIDGYKVVCSTSLLSGSVLFQRQEDVDSAQALDEDGFNAEVEVSHVHVACGAVHIVEKLGPGKRKTDITDPKEREELSALGRGLGTKWEQAMRKRAGL